MKILCLCMFLHIKNLSFINNIILKKKILSLYMKNINILTNGNNAF